MLNLSSLVDLYNVLALSKATRRNKATMWCKKYELDKLSVNLYLKPNQTKPKHTHVRAHTHTKGVNSHFSTKRFNNNIIAFNFYLMRKRDHFDLSCKLMHSNITLFNHKLSSFSFALDL